MKNKKKVPAVAPVVRPMLVCGIRNSRCGGSGIRIDGIKQVCCLIRVGGEVLWVIICCFGFIPVGATAHTQCETMFSASVPVFVFSKVSTECARRSALMYVPSLRCNLQEVEREKVFPGKEEKTEDGSRSAVTDTLSFPLSILHLESAARFPQRKRQKDEQQNQLILGFHN